MPSRRVAPLVAASVAVLGTGLALLVAIAGDGTLTSPTHAEGGPARLVVPDVVAAFPRAEHWFDIVHGLALPAGNDGRRTPRYETLTHRRVRRADEAGQVITPSYPASFDGPMRIASSADPDVYVEITPLDAAPAPLGLEDGMAVYADAFTDTDVLYKATPTHTDEYLFVRSRAAPSTWRYRVALGPGVGNVKQAGDTVEIVDRAGASRVRAASPFAVDRTGKLVRGTIRIDGDVLTLHVPLADLEVPALVDPDWAATGDMAFGRFFHRVDVLPDGRVLATGGCSASICSGDLTLPACREVVRAAEALDLGTRTFSRVGESASPRFFHVAQMLDDGDLLLAGGCFNPDCAATTLSAETFRSSTGEFTSLPDVTDIGGGAAYAKLRDGRVLVAGGCSTDGCSTMATLYEPGARRFIATAPSAFSRGRAETVRLPDGRVLVAGGCTNIDCRGVLADVEIYDPEGGAWTTVAPMGSRRAGHFGALLPDGRVLVGGGCPDQRCATILASTEIYDPRADRWTAGPPLTQPRLGADAVRLVDGRVLVSQGCAMRTECDLTNELFDPFTDGGRFDRAPSAVTGRAFHATVLAPSAGLVVANGGCQPSTCSWWVETWDVSDLVPLPEDAGVPDEDGGGIVDDGGADLDAGPPRPDAGGDAGIVRRDAGIALRAEDPGCGCGTSGREGLPAGVVPVVLALVVRTRRRRAR
jgi:hypothetical protein